MVVFLEWVRYRYESDDRVILIPLSDQSKVARAWTIVHDEMTLGKLSYLNSQLWTKWFELACRSWIGISPLQPAVVMTAVALLCAEQLPVLQLKIESKYNQHTALLDRGQSPSFFDRSSRSNEQLDPFAELGPDDDGVCIGGRQQTSADARRACKHPAHSFSAGDAG